MTDFNKLSSKKRGIVIRYIFNYDVSDIADKLKDDANIEINEVIDKKIKSTVTELIRDNYSFFLDGLGKKINNGVSNTKLGNAFTELIDPWVDHRSKFGFAITEKDDMIEVGLSKLEKKRDLESKAIKSPEDYIDAVNDDLKSIDKQAFNVYQQSFFKYHNEYKYESGRAKELAISDMNVYKDILLKQHKAIYDKTEFDNASKRIISNPKAK